VTEHEAVVHVTIAQDGRECILGYTCAAFGLKRQVRKPAEAISRVSESVSTNYALAHTVTPEERDVRLRRCGEQLYRLLDSGDRIIAAVRDQAAASDQRLVIAIDAGSGLTNLPWELLHDGVEFLALASSPVIPLRWLPQPVAGQPRPPAARPFQLLFMACAPQTGRLPALDYDAEHDVIVELARNYPLHPEIDDSGDLQSLRYRLGRRRDFDAVHLTGHAQHTAAGPVFVTEGPEGERVDAGHKELKGAMSSLSKPRLIFLSGCRTSEASDLHATASLAQSLAEDTVPCVIGWGRPVGDYAATKAAEALYEVLAQGRSLTQALAETYGRMAQLHDPYWHTLRTFVRGALPGPFVTPQSEYSQDVVLLPERVSDRMTEEWLGFIGRRRELQHAMKLLRNTSSIDPVGIMYHGPGGIGKSWLSRRIVQRLGPLFDVVKIEQKKPEDSLNREILEDRLKGLPGDGAIELMTAASKIDGTLTDVLTDFLRKYYRRPGAKPVLFFLDEFEHSFEKESTQAGDIRLVDGKPQTRTDAATTLDALIRAIVRSNAGPHRLLLTTRYPPDLTAVAQHLQAVDLGAFLSTDAERIAMRAIEALPTGRANGIQREALTAARELSAGNPRLLDGLIALASRHQDRELNIGEIQALLGRSRQEFLEKDIFAPLLLSKLSTEEDHLLRAIAPFGLPVSAEVMSQVLPVPPDQAARTADELVILSLMQRVLEPGEPVRYQVFGMLEAALATSDAEAERARHARCARALANHLGEIWHVPDARTLDREALSELRRLAERGGDTDLRLNTAAALAGAEAAWMDFDAAQQTCTKALSGPAANHRLYLVLAESTAELGAEFDPATYFRLALELCPSEEARDRANILASRAFWTGIRLPGSPVADLDEAIALAQAHGTQETLVYALRTKARALTDNAPAEVRSRDPLIRRDAALALLTEAEQLTVSMPERHQAGVLLDRAIAVHLQADDFDAALIDLDEALTLLEASGTTLDQAIVLLTQADAMIDLVEQELVEDVDKWLTKATQQAETALLRSPALRVIAAAATTRGRIAEAREWPQLAAQMYLDAADHSRRSGNLSQQLWALDALSKIALDDDSIQFNELQQRRDQIAGQLDDPQARIDVLIGSLADERTHNRVDATTAVSRARIAATLAYAAELPQRERDALELVMQNADDAGIAVTELEAPLRRLVTLLAGRYDWLLALASHRLGTLLQQMNLEAEAEPVLREALNQYEQFGLQEPAAQIHDRLAEVALALDRTDVAVAELKTAALRRIRVQQFGAAARTLVTLASTVREHDPDAAWRWLIDGRCLARGHPSGIDEGQVLDAMAAWAGSDSAPLGLPEVAALRQDAAAARDRAVALRIDLGAALTPLTDPALGRPLLRGLAALRAELAATRISSLPAVRIGFDPELTADGYRIRVWGVEAANGTIRTSVTAPEDLLAAVRMVVARHRIALARPQPAAPHDPDIDRYTLAQLLQRLSDTTDGSTT
jgi:tetratricopeptide (TPR) repeat protein